MKYVEFLHELSNAGLNIRRFAELINMNPNSVSNYASACDVPPHLAVIAVLLAELKLNEIDFYKAIARVDVQRKKPRGSGRAGKFDRNKQVENELDKKTCIND